MATYEVETFNVTSYEYTPASTTDLKTNTTIHYETKWTIEKEFTKYIFKSNRSKEYKKKYNIFCNTGSFEEYQEYRNFKKVYIIKHCSKYTGTNID